MPPPSRRPDAGRVRDRRVAVPVHRHDRLHDRASARVPGGRHERELEIKAAEKRLALLENRTCRNCGSEIDPSYLRCPNCMRKLKEPCRTAASRSTRAGGCARTARRRSRPPLRPGRRAAPPAAPGRPHRGRQARGRARRPERPEREPAAPRARAADRDGGERADAQPSRSRRAHRPHQPVARADVSAPADPPQGLRACT